MSGPDNSGFTLGDLLDCQELGLQLVAGGANCTRRQLRGAHCADLPHPADSLDRDWLLLTTGSHLGVSAAEDAEFVAELSEAGVAGMGFALGVAHDHVPAGILAASDERDFPVFAVPPRTSLREITALVFRAVSSPDVRASRRLVVMQRLLVETLSDENPRDRLLSTLASVLEARVAMVSALGDIEFQTGPPPATAILQCIESGTATIVHLDLPNFHGFALPVGEDDSTTRDWLVLTWPIPRKVPELAKAAAQLAVPLLSAISRLSRAETVVTREMRRAALEALIEPSGSDDPRMLNGRCRAYGLDLSVGLRAVALVGSAGEPTTSLLGDVERSLEEAHVPFLAAARGEMVAVLLPATVTDGFIAEHLLVLDPTLRAGVGRAVVEGRGLRDSWADARLAVVAHTRRALKRIIRYDDLDLGTILLNEIPVERLEPKINELLGPLHENPLIRETLVVYFGRDQDVGRTARALNLHPNSVRYRLARAEAILGVSIRASSTIMALHMALELGEFTDDIGDDRAVRAKVSEIRPNGHLSMARSA
jgi:DNA-binding PucR family transcriptional regulator